MNRRVRQSAVVAGWLLAALAAPIPAAAQGGEAGASSSVRMTPWATIRGGISQCVSSALSEYFGSSIVSLGDINGDGNADVLIGRVRCDTTQRIPWRDTVSKYAPFDLLLYRGVRGRAPLWSEGERIGSPSVLAANVQYLAHGDWDADGWVDLAVSYDDYTDSSTARPIGVIFRVVVLWGQRGGWFDFSDTTRLSAFGTEFWRVVHNGLHYDLNDDGVDDLAIGGGTLYKDSAVLTLPPLIVYLGNRGARWGRKGIGRDIGWSWQATTAAWFSDLVGVMDQDCDGRLDLVGRTLVTGTGYSAMSVLYGRTGIEPDTNEAEGIWASAANGKVLMLVDVTGDGVPELCMNTGSEETIKVYLGRPGQRLRQQYGSGADSPAPDSGRPWARPWSEIWLPDRYDQGFPNENQMIWTPGDLDLDGIDDLCAMTYPYMLCYTTARGMDNAVDADIPALYNAAVVRLGDVDGSGVATFALQGENAVLLLKGSRQIVPSGANIAYPWHAPDFRCEHASGVPPDDVSAGLGYLAIGLHPNPARDKASITWAPMSGGAVVTVVDPLGNIVLRDHLSAERGQYSLDLRRVGRGAYLVVVRIGDVAGSATLVAR